MPSDPTCRSLDDLSLPSCTVLRGARFRRLFEPSSVSNSRRLITELGTKLLPVMDFLFSCGFCQPVSGNSKMSMATWPPLPTSKTSLCLLMYFQWIVFSGRLRIMPNFLQNSTGSSSGILCSTTCTVRIPEQPPIPTGTSADKTKFVTPPMPFAFICKVGTIRGFRP